MYRDVERVSRGTTLCGHFFPSEKGEFSKNEKSNSLCIAKSWGGGTCPPALTWFLMSMSFFKILVPWVIFKRYEPLKRDFEIEKFLAEQFLYLYLYAT